MNNNEINKIYAIAKVNLHGCYESTAKLLYSTNLVEAYF